MRGPVRRAFAAFVFLGAFAAAHSLSAAGQQPQRSVGLAGDPTLPILTRLEAVLMTPNAVLMTDIYHIDMRFGPGVALDALVVTALDSQSRTRGLRIGLRDDGKTPRTVVTYLDFEEVGALSRALASMMAAAGKFTSQEEQRSRDLSFMTHGGFGVAVHESARVQKAELSAGLIDPIRTALELTEFVTLKQGVDQALTILADK